MHQAAAGVDLVAASAFGTRVRPSPSPGNRHKTYQITATDEGGDDENTRVHGFLGGAAAVLPLTASAQRAPASPVRQDWLDRRKEPALESKCVRWARQSVNRMAAMCASGCCGKAKVAAGIVGHADLTLRSRGLISSPALPCAFIALTRLADERSRLSGAPAGSCAQTSPLRHRV